MSKRRTLTTSIGNRYAHLTYLLTNGNQTDIQNRPGYLQSDQEFPHSTAGPESNQLFKSRLPIFS